VRARFFAALTIAALAWPASALADTAQSSNWAGYAAHGSGVSFHSVLATWRQPRGRCQPGKQSYSAFWVGLGGYNPTSTALEQIGTEMDCKASGKAVSSAWFELVPAPSTPIRLKIRPGDQVTAGVSVDGHQVTVVLDDVTRHRSFHRTLLAADVDVTSAEWIVEAPSDCINIDACQTLPLANFGSTTFHLASAVSSGGHQGSISDPAWRWTKIRLSPGGRRFVVYRGKGASAGAASPSTLRLKGSSFKVTFARVAVPSNQYFAARVGSQLAGHLFH
jgi:Peptidase A4 family